MIQLIESKSGVSYRIEMEGRRIGFVGMEKGATPLIHHRYDQQTLEGIEEAVARLHPQPLAPIKQLPPAPDKPQAARSDDY
mgnify:CR=1 FL=1